MHLTQEKISFFLLSLFLFLSLSTLPCLGQRYLVKCYSETDGLASSDVYDVTQDRWGRIWFATRAGISCCDSATWRSYTVSDGLPALSFLKITTTPDGKVWALSESGQAEGITICFFDQETWTQVPHLPVKIPGKGKVTFFHVFLGEKPGSPPVIAVGSADFGLYLLKDGVWQKISNTDWLPGDELIGGAALGNKSYLVSRKGIVKMDKEGSIDQHVVELPVFIDKKIRGICIEEKNRYPGNVVGKNKIWVIGSDWLGYFYEDSRDFVFVINRLSTNETSVNKKDQERKRKSNLYNTYFSFNSPNTLIHALPDYRGGLYIADLFEVFYVNYRSGEIESLSTQSGLSSQGCTSLFIDFERDVWFSSRRGVSKIASRCFTNFQRIDGLLEDEVTAIVEYRPGRFVLGHNKGITLFDGQQFREIPFTQPDGTLYTSCRVLDMKVDGDHNVWVAAQGIGLARISLHDKIAIQWFDYQSGLPRQVTCLWIDPNDEMWVGTTGNIFKKKGEKFVPFRPGIGPHTLVRKIYKTKGGSLLFCSQDRGISMLENERWRNYRLPGDNRNNNVYSVMEDSRGRLFAGTLGGLYFLHQGTFEKFQEKDFHIDRPIYFITEDRQQHLWFGTDNGVLHWDGYRHIHYSLREGLIGQETNRAAGVVDNRGRLWIGTNRGLSIYRQQFDNHTGWRPAPKLRLVYLEADGQVFPFDMDNEDQPLFLGPRTRSLVFHFSGISFLDEDALSIKHKLENFENEWLLGQYPQNQAIRYTNLAAGVYRFHLAARNVLGQWSSTAISPKLIILEPFYKSWWFFLFSGAIFFFLFYAVFRFHSQRRYAAALEKEAEKRSRKLVAAEKRYRILFEESQDAVFISSPSGKLMDINPAGAKLFGFSSKEELIMEKNEADLYYNPVDRKRFLDQIEKNGFVKDYELALKSKDGDKLTVLVTATLVRDTNGRAAVYRGIIRDISEKKRLEQQLLQSQKMEAIGTLAGGIAHDFNNILGIILGNTELLCEDLPEDSPAHRDAEQICKAAERAADLVRQILTFSRQADRERKPLELAAVIKEALRLIRSSMPASIEIRRNFHISPKNSRVLADLTQMHQVIMNLCANAAHAMGAKGGTLDVSLDEVYLDESYLRRSDDITPGNYLRISIGDTGHGIPPTILKRIFEPYFTTKKTGEGTGMGLALVHGIIKAHGGDITVYSELGKGTTFHVFLPRLLEKGDGTGGARQPQQIPIGTERILLVDDEIALTQVGQKVLSRLGYEVIGMAAPETALELFKNDPQAFDLIITDLNMPHLSGTGLAAEARKIRSDIPIIFCSGFSTALTDEEMKLYGEDNFIMKPVIKSNLARIVRNVLDKNK